MTKKEYVKYLFIFFLLFALFFTLILAAYICESVDVSPKVCYSLLFVGFGFGFASLIYLFVNYKRAYSYEKQAKENKIDSEECEVIDNFDIEALKDLLRKKKFEENGDCFYKRKYSLIKDTTKCYVKFYDGRDLEATLADGKKNLDTYIHFTYSICHILIVSMDNVTEQDIKLLKDFTKKYKVPEEMLAKVSHYNNIVCFLVDKSLGKAYYIDPDMAKLTTYAYGVRVIKGLYKQNKKSLK